MWDENDNGGRGGWVIPGLSQKMGGPAKGGTAEVAEAQPEGGKQYSDADVEKMRNAPATLDNARSDYLRGGYDDAYQKLLQMEKADPKVKTDPKYQKLRKHVEIELNIG